MMRHIERRMSLPLYWLRTRRIEKKRRHLENVAFKGEKGNAKAMKKELDEIIEELNRKAHPIQSP